MEGWKRGAFDIPRPLLTVKLNGDDDAVKARFQAKSPDDTFQQIDKMWGEVGRHAYF